jgi:hypothetical protein
LTLLAAPESDEGGMTADSKGLKARQMIAQGNALG